MPVTRRSKVKEKAKEPDDVQAVLYGSLSMHCAVERLPQKYLKERKSNNISVENAKKQKKEKNPVKSYSGKDVKQKKCSSKQKPASKRKIEDTVIPSPKIFDFDESDEETCAENSFSLKRKAKPSKRRTTSQNLTKNLSKRIIYQKQIISGMKAVNKSKAKKSKIRSPVSDDSGVFMTPPSAESTVSSSSSTTSTPHLVLAKPNSHVQAKLISEGAANDSKIGKRGLPSPRLDLSPVELATPMMDAQVLSQVSCDESQETTMDLGSPKLTKAHSSPTQPAATYNRDNNPDMDEPVQMKKKPRSKKKEKESMTKWDIVAEMMNSEFEDIDENFELSIE